MLRAYGIEVDSIEVFEYHVLVQEVLSGLIYCVPFCAIEEFNADAAQEPESNTVSMKGWIEWQKEKRQKTNLQKTKIKRLCHQKPKLRLVV